VSAGVRRPLLGELLLQAKVVTQAQLAEVLAAQKEPTSCRKIGQLLMERGWLTEAQLTQTLSLQFSVPWVSLSHIDFSRPLLDRVSRELADKHCLIPIFVRHVKGQGETLYVAMDDPTNTAALTEVARQASLPARPMIASATDIRSAIRVYYGEPATSSVYVASSPPRVPSPPAPGVKEVSAPKAPQPRVTRPPASVGATSATSAAPESEPEIEEVPPTTRMSPPADSVVATQPVPEMPQVPRDEDSEPRRMRAKVLNNLTLLDGTRVKLPSSNSEQGPEAVIARGFVKALRARAARQEGAAGEKPIRWEPVMAALLAILLRKGLITERELVEELRNP
jgi:type IV pilus assembly protein PilB